jgi:DNA-binding beta-propeller fold protein YncE
LLAVLLVACAAPRAAAGTVTDGQVVYVANAGDGTVTRLDSATGRALGVPVPAGQGPGWLVPGRDSTLLVLGIGAAARGTLTYVARAGSTWVARPLALEPDASAVAVAGNGQYTAAVVFTLRGPGATPAQRACRLALVDLRTGTVGRRWPVCRPGDEPTGLAMDTDAGGPVAYVALRARPDERHEDRGAGQGRIVAVDLTSGLPVAETPLAGEPGALVLAAAPGSTGRRLYTVQSPPDTPECAGNEWCSASQANGWRLIGRDPATLVPEVDYPLPFPPLWLTISPDGRHGYVFAPEFASGYGDAAVLVQIDLRSGALRPLARFARPSLGPIVVVGRRLYVPLPDQQAVWVLDPHGRVQQTIRVGQAPIGLAVSAPIGSADPVELRARW